MMPEKITIEERVWRLALRYGPEWDRGVLAYIEGEFRVVVAERTKALRADLDRTQAVMKTSARYINELCNPPSHYAPDDYDEEGRSPMTFLRLDYENALAALDAPPEGEG